MAAVGRACLIFALVAAIYGAGASLYGALAGGRAWVDSGRRAVYALAGLLTVAFVILEAAFLRSDFSFSLVASHSSTTTPLLYKLAAPWSSQEGSLLLWAWLLALWSSLALFLTRRRLREIAPYATAVLLGFGTFFCLMVVLVANPFEVLARAPVDGQGLNPLLRHATMLIHPPLLYGGYTLLAIPFAFAIGAVITHRLGSEWIVATRRFALGAWLCLGLGILLGARWSYTELGWGGYWAWDPVENAALMPWLTGTAFLHSVMIQEKRGMLKVWNASLVLASGVLAVLGTFLVRSGVLQSIHAFTGYGSAIAISFLILIALMVAGSVALVVVRRAELRSEHRLDSVFSREAVFLLQNVVLVGLCFVIFWGTFFPLISEAITGTKSSLGPPWFGRFVVPLALVLVLLSGIGPVIAWRRGTGASLVRNLAIPVAAALATLVALVAVGGVAHKPLALVMFCLGALVLAAVGQELWRGVRARRAMAGESAPVALLALVRRNRRRYGGYLAHAGFAVLLVGVAASSAFAHVTERPLRPGQTARVDGYSFRYVRPTISATPERLAVGALLDVSRDGRRVGWLRTSQGYYPPESSRSVLGRFFEGEVETQVGLRAGLRRDVWTAIRPDVSGLHAGIGRGDREFVTQRGSLAGYQQAFARYLRHPPPAIFRFIVSPLVSWLWLGGLIVAAGALVALWPPPLRARGRVRARYAARVRRELARV